MHRAQWPSAVPVAEAAGDGNAALVGAAGAALSALRKVKSDAKVSQRTVIESVTVAVPDVALVEGARANLESAGRVVALTFAQSPDSETLASSPVLAVTEG